MSVPFRARQKDAVLIEERGDTAIFVHAQWGWLWNNYAINHEDAVAITNVNNAIAILVGPRLNDLFVS